MNVRRDKGPDALAWLREQIRRGYESGDAEPLDMAALKHRARAEFEASRTGCAADEAGR